jgi:hypothetical protein
MRRTPLSLLSLAVLAASGCTNEAAPPAGAGGQGGEGGQPSSGPVYVLGTHAVDATSGTVALSFHPSIDELDPSSIEDGARTFENVANFEAIAGRLYVSSGDAPEITQFTIGPELDWQEGPTVSFAAYGLSDNANWYRHYIIDEDRVILPFDTFSRVIWSPEEMLLLEDLDDTSLPPEVDGFTYYNDGGNPAGARFSVGPAVQPFYTFGGPDYMYGPTSALVVYDDEFREETTWSVPCPDLETTSRAEDGSTYVSNTWHSGVYALFGLGLEPCVVRLDPSGHLDEEFTTTFTEQTGGRYTQNFTYLRDGKAIAHVLDHDALAADFDVDWESGDYDVTLEYALLEGGYMDAWLFDVATGTAQEITGIDVPLTQRPASLVLDDRMFLLVVDPDFASTRVFEISNDAVATPLFDAPGSVVGLQRLR